MTCSQARRVSYQAPAVLLASALLSSRGPFLIELDAQWSVDPARRRELSTPYRLPAVPARVIDEVRGNPEDR